ncbi:MAG: Rpn family recombination-promoting nuclease/putative transposase, partial [Acetomicrobium sp.]
YMTVTWDEQKKKNKPLIPIIPVVIYHGSSSWNVTTHFQGQFDSLNESIKPYVPEFNYVLVDLTQIPNKEIEQKAKDTPFLMASLLLMKLVALGDIEGIIKIAVIIKLSEEERIILILYLFYTLDVDQDTMQRIVKELGGEEIMPSLAEKLMSKGEIKGKQDLLIKQLRRKFGLSSSEEKMIRSVTDEAKLDAAAEAVLDAKSKDEVLKMLG